MSRYIDADKIDYTVTIVGIDENAGYRAVAFESDIDDMPTADVVPKSEVEEIFKVLERDVFVPHFNTYFLRLTKYEEIKKKYLEENK